MDMKPSQMTVQMRASLVKQVKWHNPATTTSREPTVQLFNPTALREEDAYMIAHKRACDKNDTLVTSMRSLPRLER